MTTKRKTSVPKQSTTEPENRTGDLVHENEEDKSMSGIYGQYESGNLSLDDIFNNAIEVESEFSDLDIFKDAKLDSLKGVPFAILGGTFRERMVDGKYSDFVTLTCVIASEKILEKRKVRYTNTEVWFPEQVFGINDGSTGIRRQVVSHLHTHGIIRVVPEGAEIVESGKRGESTWDRRLGEWDWKDGEHTIKDDKETGADLMVWDFAFKDKAMGIPRGIRVSEYPGRYGTVVTRYLG
jgi:hypothetical protein